MIGMNMKIITENESFLVPITARCAINFERQFKIGLAKAFSQEQRMEHLYWLAWECVKASGRVVKPFDSWLDEIQQVQFIFNEEPDPLEGKE